MSRRRTVLRSLPLVLFAPALAAGVLLGCSGSSQQTCEDYVPPLPACRAGTVFVCETTDEGCRVCSCESTGPPVDIGPADPYEP